MPSLKRPLPLDGFASPQRNTLRSGDGHSIFKFKWIGVRSRSASWPRLVRGLSLFHGNTLSPYHMLLFSGPLQIFR